MNSLLICFINKNYINKANKIIDSFHRLKIENYVFFCLDQYSFDSLLTSKKELHIFDFENTWNGKKALWIKRIEILSDLINHYSLLHFDADTVWLKNPMSIMQDSSVDMYFTCGLNYPDQIFKKWGFVVRGGFYFLRQNFFVQKFVKKWVEYVNRYLDDQIALNHLLQDMDVAWNIPAEKYYIIDYKHSNNKLYNIMYCKDYIRGQIEQHEINILSTFYFPRLKTQYKDAYVLDLYNESEYILSCI